MSNQSRGYRNGNTLAIRSLSSLVGLPLVLLVVWLGPLWLASMTAVAAILGILELYRMAISRDIKPPLVPGIIWTAALVISGLLPLAYTALVVLIGALGTLIWLIPNLTSGKVLHRGGLALVGPLYLGYSLAHVVGLRNTTQGWEWVFHVLISTFATDTAAYLVGRSVGKRLMAPRVSPNKTWEGAAGGLIGGVVASMCMATILDLPVPVWKSAILGVSISILAQLGDLTESLIKRVYRAKNAGSLIPGHGGILDRLDSLIFTVVGLYYLRIWSIS
jgi:phosphatidate cytidylyltransferase